MPNGYLFNLYKRTVTTSNITYYFGSVKPQVLSASNTQLIYTVAGADTETAKAGGDYNALTADKIPLTSTDKTTVETALKYRSNPNLLDSWYFGNPVNQRNGYIVPAGVDYYTFAWEKIGQTDKNYQVLLRRNAENNYDCEIEINGTRYVVAGANSVPGYCTIGHTIDRWKLDIGEAVTLEDGCICLKKSGTYFGEYFDDFNQFIGMTLTGSVLLQDGTLRTGSFVYNGLVNQGQTFFSSELGFYVQKLSDSLTQCEINSLVDNVKIKAAKLELGST